MDVLARVQRKAAKLKIYVIFGAAWRGRRCLCHVSRGDMVAKLRVGRKEQISGNISL